MTVVQGHDNCCHQCPLRGHWWTHLGQQQAGRKVIRAGHCVRHERDASMHICTVNGQVLKCYCVVVKSQRGHRGANAEEWCLQLYQTHLWQMTWNVPFGQRIHLWQCFNIHQVDHMITSASVRAFIAITIVTTTVNSVFLLIFAGDLQIQAVLQVLGVQVWAVSHRCLPPA